jgi:exopolysaccharide biosynthesis operon protein EpsL
MLIQRLCPFVLLVCLSFAAPAGASPSDALKVYVGVLYGRDDNLPRVPDGSPGFNNEREDFWRTSEYGLVFDRTYSRQNIFIVAKLSTTSFNRFKQLDYNGRDMQANWLWQLGNRLDGKIGTTYQKVLTPYTDFAISERNLRISRGRYADGTWRFNSSWRARAEFKRVEYEYELTSQRYNNRIEDSSELELDYLTRSDSTVGVVARQVRGKFQPLRLGGPFTFNNNFTQDELKLRLKWIVSGTTTLDALVGYTSRKQLSFGEGRTEGVAGKIEAAYQPRGKMSYRAAVWRDFAPLESLVVSYTLNNGASLSAQWDVSSKIKVNSNVIAEQRNYKARGNVVSAFGDLRDSICTASVQGTWSPRPTAQVSAGLTHQMRSGSAALGTGSFKSNSMTLSARAQF